MIGELVNHHPSSQREREREWAFIDIKTEDKIQLKSSNITDLYDNQILDNFKSFLCQQTISQTYADIYS